MWKCVRVVGYFHYSKSVHDKFRRRCIGCKRTKGIRFGSFFEKTRLLLTHHVVMLYQWCMRVPQTTVREMMHFSTHTSVDYYNFYRDEAQILKKPKSNRGNARDDAWVFGCVERENSNNVIFHLLHLKVGPRGNLSADRSRECLLPLIQRYIRRGTTHIVSDEWSAYLTQTSEGQSDLSTFGDREYVHSWVGEPLWELCEPRWCICAHSNYRRLLECKAKKIIWSLWRVSTKSYSHRTLVSVCTYAGVPHGQKKGAFYYKMVANIIEQYDVSSSVTILLVSFFRFLLHFLEFSLSNIFMYILYKIYMSTVHHIDTSIRLPAV